MIDLQGKSFERRATSCEQIQLDGLWLLAASGVARGSQLKARGYSTISPL